MSNLPVASAASSALSSRSELVESLEFALQTGAKLVERLRVIDFKSYEPLAPDTATSLMLRGAVKQVQQSMGDVASLLTTLPALLSDGPLPAEALVQENADEWDLDGVPATNGDAAPLHDRFCEEIDAALEGLTSNIGDRLPFEVLGNSCQMLVLELRRARGRLIDAQRRRSKWGMITEGEEARRKAMKALQAGITLSARMLHVDLSDTVFSAQPTETNMALAARELVFEFRVNVESIVAGIDRMPVNELALRLRDARILLLELFSSPTYHALRAPDRYALQQLRERAAAWLDTLWDDAEAARQVLLDLQVFVELLAGVNRREVLVQHDRGIIEAARNELSDLMATTALTRESPWPSYASALRSLRRARWRDEELDNLVARELRRGESTVVELAPRIQALLDVLGRVRF